MTGLRDFFALAVLATVALALWCAPLIADLILAVLGPASGPAFEFLGDLMDLYR